MNLVRARSWGSVKPMLGAQLDQGHPLATGLIEAWLFNEHGGLPRSLRLGLPSSSPSNLTWRGSPKGSGINLAAGALTLGTEGANGLRLPTTSCTIAFGKRVSSGTGGGDFGLADGGAAGLDIYCPYVDGTTYFDFGGNTGAHRISVAGSNPLNDHEWAFTAGLRGSGIWQDGVLRTSQTTAITRTATAAALRLGVVGTGANTTSTYRYLYIWDRELSADHIAWLAAEPYAFIQPPGPKILYFAMGAPTPLVTGTSATTEANDTSTASGGFGPSGTSATTDADDTSSGLGTVTAPTTAAATVGSGRAANPRALADAQVRREHLRQDDEEILLLL